jgi:hypothetical protein
MFIFGGDVDMKEREGRNDTRLELCEVRPISHNLDFSRLLRRTRLTNSKPEISDFKKFFSLSFKPLLQGNSIYNEPFKSFSRNSRPILPP